MKPWARKRARRRWATRCSRCRWTTSSVSSPASRKTTGRIGASFRHSSRFWPRFIGARRLSRVAAQDGSEATRPVSEGRRHTARPASSRSARRGAAFWILSEQERARRKADGRKRTQSRDCSSSDRHFSIWSCRSRWRARADSSSSATACLCSAARSSFPSSAAKPGAPRRVIPSWFSRRSMPSSITLPRLPSSSRIVSVLRTSTSSTRSSWRCGNLK